MSNLTYAAAIGAYRLADFVELNLCRVRVIFGPETECIVCDNVSPESPRIKEVAEKHDAAYSCITPRQSHFAADWQTFINGLVFARRVGADICMKISQRFVPVLPRFKGVLDAAFDNPQIWIVLPGRPQLRQIARPQARFYSKFGCLTDFVAMRVSEINPNMMLQRYRERVAHPKAKWDSLIECTIGDLIANEWKDHHLLAPELTNHVAFQPKLYLRKAQSTQAEYAKVAAMDGIKGNWNLEEWLRIEGKVLYFCKPTKV